MQRKNHLLALRLEQGPLTYISAADWWDAAGIARIPSMSETEIPAVCGAFQQCYSFSEHKCQTGASLHTISQYTFHIILTWTICFERLLWEVFGPKGFLSYKGECCVVSEADVTSSAHVGLLVIWLAMSWKIDIVYLTPCLNQTRCQWRGNCLSTSDATHSYKTWQKSIKYHTANQKSVWAELTGTLRSQWS